MKSYYLQKNPFIVPTNDGKRIEEHFGCTTAPDEPISLAKMLAPPGWSEPFQTPEFDEYTFVIKGKKQITIVDQVVILEAGQSIKIPKNTRVKYANPFQEPCEYISVCSPPFSMDKVHRAL